MADNASGAICRLIMKNPSAIPLDQVLPVILQHLPLKKDFEENEPVYRCVLHLLQSNNPFVCTTSCGPLTRFLLMQIVLQLMQNMPHLLSVFGQVLGPPESQLKGSTRADILGLLRTLQVRRIDRSYRSSITETSLFSRITRKASQPCYRVFPQNTAPRLLLH